MIVVKWIFVIILFLIIITPISAYGYYQYQNNNLEKDTYTYLTEKGYNDDDILSIETKLEKLSLFTAEVIFTNEPNVTYQYKKDNKQIIQIGPVREQEADYEYKHIE
ncbi:DUF3139 domain-containing protein [Virgibacillus sp. C22-A2]|uniref:DUF3139 domain-containing protein n=1 Tax=Virgibacillus tibetensis TaxID=3042313 RepID=A0ABU6KIY3_9BACI|nr:DUF3139 domain-containing protein [Virgibacillus sp. C22-A2]